MERGRSPRMAIKITGKFVGARGAMLGAFRLLLLLLLLLLQLQLLLLTLLPRPRLRRVRLLLSRLLWLKGLADVCCCCSLKHCCLIELGEPNKGAAVGGG